MKRFWLIIGGLLAITAILALLLLSDSRLYVRTAALPPAESAVPEPTNWVVSREGPLVFEYPLNWPIIRQATGASGGGKEVILPGVRIIVFDEAADAETLTQELLATPLDDLIIWPGAVGSTTGTFGAKASELKGTRAPEGSRVYVTQAEATTVAILLREPPYEHLERFLASVSIP